MKFLFMLTLLFTFMCQVANAGYYDYQGGQRYYCTLDDDGGDDDNNYLCVSNCIGRSGIDGSCYSYGSDYCGNNASCVENCIGRSGIDGSCYSYGADICTSD